VSAAAVHNKNKKTLRISENFMPAIPLTRFQRRSRSREKTLCCRRVLGQGMHSDGHCIVDSNKPDAI
jgi:hypothetical protein